MLQLKPFWIVPVEKIAAIKLRPNEKYCFILSEHVRGNERYVYLRYFLPGE